MIVPLSPTRQLHHKTIKTSLGDIADMPNTDKIRRQRKNILHEGTRESPRKKDLKEVDELETTKIPDAEFKITVIRMLKDLREEQMISVST